MVDSHVRFAVLAVVAIVILATPVSAQLRDLTPVQVANLRARAEQGDVTLEGLLDGAIGVSGLLSWSCGARCKIGRGFRLDDAQAPRGESVAVINGKVSSDLIRKVDTRNKRIWIS